MSRPLAPRNWRLQPSRGKPPTIILPQGGVHPGPPPLDRPTRKTLEERKARITLAKLKFMGDE